MQTLLRPKESPDDFRSEKMNSFMALAQNKVS